MADRQGGEGGERRLPIGQRLSDITRRKRVEAGQAEIGQHDEAEGREQAPSGNRHHRFLDLIKGIAAEAAIDEQGGQADHDANKDLQDVVSGDHGPSLAQSSKSGTKSRQTGSLRYE